jgi:hypothetical protein
LHSLALKKDGSVWAWNGNNMGQLGNGTTEDSTVPVRVTGLTDVVRIAAGMYHSLAVKSDGTVWAWGSGSSGQLGTGNMVVYQTIPVQTKLYSGVSEIVADVNGSLAVSRAGTIWTWGYSGTQSIYSPVQKLGLYLYHRLSAKFLTGWGPDSDGDEDGIPDNRDLCPDTPSNNLVDAFGCAIADGDVNRDGRIDLTDVLLGLKVITTQHQSVQVSSDIDGDCKLDLKDVVYTIQHVGE